MKTKIIPGLMGLLTLTTGLGACSGDDYYTTEVNSECIITAATLGTLVREMHTLDSKGQDSVFYVSVTGSYYPMTIDQESRTIYNLDSLPAGTDPTRVTFATVNSRGTVSILSRYTGKDTIFNESDSTDMSIPRFFKVYATDGSSTREYMMTVNVHREEGDSTVWHRVATRAAEVAGMTSTRSFAIDGRLYLFGMNNGTPQLCTANADDYKDGGTAQWTSTPTQPAIRPQSVVRYNGQFFATSAEGQILSSVNGTDWVSTGASLQASTLVAAGSDQLIAMSNGKFYSSPDGISWTEDAADESEYLPTGAVDGTCIPSPLHKTFETLIAVGQRDGKSVVWARDIDLTGRETFPWTYFPISDEDYAYNIPALNEITLNTYDGVPLLSGLTPEGQCAPLYLSRDNGHSWKDGELKTPAAQAQGALSVTVDDDKFVWMFCGQTGEVWRGRINRLGWKNINGSFERALKRN